MYNRIISVKLACVLLLPLLLLILAACTPAAAPLPPTQTEPPPPTVTATPLPTHTATLKPSDTPLPTETPTPVPTDTPVPTATPDRTATASVRATAEYEAVLERIIDDLLPYELSVSEGQLAWYSKEPITLRLTGYNVYDYEMIGKKLSLANFIFKTDITWDSKTGLMTCGLAFRVKSDVENGPHYLFQTLRLSGLPAWDIEYWNFGNFDHNVTGRVRTSAVIDQKAGATNHYVVVANKTLLTVYANGQRLSNAESTKLIEGMLAFFATQESGESTCKFDNTWIWALP